ncbi:MAG: hypothetical protein JXA61_02895 [Bacteroidales bacterium]|nr:hypothetical protein [Bacteroidales bacterium]
MLKTTFLIAILFGTCFSGKLAAQEVAFSVEVTAAANGQAADGTISVDIQTGRPAFTVYLFDKAPWKGGRQLQKHEKADAGTIIFSELMPGDYYIIVEDKDKNPAARAVYLGIKPD